MRNSDGQHPPTVRRTQRARRPVPILVVDRNALANAGLRHTLANSPYRLVAACRTVGEAREKAFSYSECVLIIGLDPQSRQALDEIARTKAEHGRLSIIVLAEVLDPEELVAALSAGANAYLVKNEISPDTVLKVIELVLLGCVILPGGMYAVAWRLGRQAAEDPDEIPVDAAERDLGPQTQKDGLQGTNEELSSREQMIVRHLMRGASNKEIARELQIAESTVKVHIRRLLRKIQVRNRTQVAVWALDNKIRPMVQEEQNPAIG